MCLKNILDESRKEAYTLCKADIDELFKIESLVVVPDLLFKKYEIGTNDNFTALFFSIVPILENYDFA